MTKVHVDGRWHPLPGCEHGPKTWPWWKLCTFSFVRLTCELPSTGYRLWCYTRAGGRTLDIYLDRRKSR